MVFFKREYKGMEKVSFCRVELMIATSLVVAAAVMVQRLPLSLSGGHHLCLLPSLHKCLLCDFFDNVKSKRKEPLTCSRVWATGHIDHIVHARSNFEDQSNMCKDTQDMQFYIQLFASTLISNVFASTRKEKDIQSRAKEFTYKHTLSFLQKRRVPSQMPTLFSSTFHRS